MEFAKVLRDIWNKNKLEFFFWVVILILVVPFVVVFSLHHFLEGATEDLDLPPVLNKMLRFGLVEIISLFIVEVFVLMLISRFNRLCCLIASRCKCKKSEIKQSIANIVRHLLSRSTACNLYGSLLVSKLAGAHIPRDKEGIGHSFLFVRRDVDFELSSSSQPRNVLSLRNNANDESENKSMGTIIHGDVNHLRELLMRKQIDDFHTIQQCIRKSWDTVAYGDFAVLLEKPVYLTHNIRLIRRRMRKRKVRRLFVYPWYRGTHTGLLSFIGELRRNALSADILDKLIRTNPVSGLPGTSIDTVEEHVSGINKDVAKALVDAIYLVWLVKLHEIYGIDYRIVPRHRTRDKASMDIVGDHLLNSWNDEGSALIDNEVVVRFDDQQQLGGVIYYEFIKDTDRVASYKQTFDTIWGTHRPRSYTLEASSTDGTESLRDFFTMFFDETSCGTLLEISVESWIDIIQNEL